MKNLLLLCEMFLGQLQQNRRQQTDGDQVGNNHEAVEGIGDTPDQTEVDGSADDGDEGIGDGVDLDALVAEDEFDAAAAVETPAEDGGEGEAAHGNGGEDGDPGTVAGGEAGDGQFGAII